MTDRKYNLYLSSSDKISGSLNNNANFNVIWDSFLPREYNNLYEVTFNFQSTGGYYKDIATISGNLGYIDNASKVYSQLKIVADFQGRSYSYDSSTNGPSLVLGYATREPTSSTPNGFASFFGFNAPKMISRPTQSNINIKIYNSFNNGFLYDTSLDGSSVKTDMQPWTMILTFRPIASNT